jgi:hypothetical protein
VTVPLGQQPGNYTGTINITPSNADPANLTLRVEVPENRTWTMDPTYCEKSESPDAGEVCNVTVTNQGNIFINFTISPPTGNFTSLSDTNFSVPPNSSFDFTVFYNVSGEQKLFYNSTFIIAANHSSANPLNRTLNIQLIPFIVPLISLKVEPSKIQQTESVGIFVNVTDRSGAGIGLTTANITTPNGTEFILEMNNTNTEGNLSEWHITFPGVNLSNTSRSIGISLERGIYSLVIFTEDNAGVNDTAESNFTVSANFSTVLSTLKSSYAQGTTGTIFYKTMDSNSTPLEGASVTLTITDPTGNITFNSSFLTDSDGLISPLPTFSVANDAALGEYNLTAFSVFSDYITNETVTSTSIATFTVTSTTTGGLFADVETDVVWYPNQVMKFKITVSDSAGTPTDPDFMNLSVFDPADNIYFTASLSDMTKEATGLYTYSYSMPLSTSTGVYFAVINASKDDLTTLSLKAFKVSAGGPYDLSINLLESTVSPGDYLDFNIIIENKGEIAIDVLLEYWVTQEETTWFFASSTVLTPPLSNTTVTKNAFIFNSQPLGLATLNAKVTFDNIQPPVTANTTFEIVQAVEPPTAPPPPEAAVPPATVSPVVPEIPAKEYDLVITDYPKRIDIVQGWTDIYSVQVQNNGTGDLKNVSLLLTGIPSPWVTVKPQMMELLTPGNSSIFIIEYKIPANALTQ